MTDIVPTLRAMRLCPTICGAAADEIERLRSALQRVAEQKTQEEVGEDGLDSSEVSWEEGFDALVLIAREALNQQITRS